MGVAVAGKLSEHGRLSARWPYAPQRSRILCSSLSSADMVTNPNPPSTGMEVTALSHGFWPLCQWNLCLPGIGLDPSSLRRKKG